MDEQAAIERVVEACAMRLSDRRVSMGEEDLIRDAMQSWNPACR
jgi:hypothetical protein